MSAYRRLYIWVEGPDDERFFQDIVSPRFTSRYDQIIIRRYAGLTPDKVGDFLRNIKAMNDDYLFVADVDNSPCITSKKATLTARYKYLEVANIIVVKAEIESWYHAGLEQEVCTRLRLKHLTNTEPLTKEKFQAARPHRFSSGIDFMIEVLDHFNSETACSQNASLAYFFGKYGLRDA